MKIHRMLAIAEKEMFHLLRDRLTLAVALLLPVIIVAILGAAIEFNVQDLKLAVYDQDRSMASRSLIETFTSSGYFIPVGVSRPASAMSALESERARAALLIEPEFEKNVRSGRGGEAQILIDGSDSSIVGPIQGYASLVQSLAAQRITQETTKPLVQLQTRFLYNPELRSRWYIVPGVGVVVLAILSVLLTSLTVAKEWENGSMELLLSTPVRPIEIIVGKILPYLGLGFVALSFVYVIARLGFGVPFRGSHFIYLFGTFLFLMACFAQGVLISVLTRVQEVAMQNALVSGLLPALLLSGFIFSIKNMPPLFNVMTSALGARWFMEISRSSFLRDGHIKALEIPLFALGAICFALIGLALKKFKTDVEP